MRHAELRSAVRTPIIALVAAGLLSGLAGCSPKVVDISSAYWDSQAGPYPVNAPGWPFWSGPPARGVYIGECGLFEPPIQCAEQVLFLWDEKGLYANVLGFKFPKIEIVADNTLTAVHVTAPGGWPERSFGTIDAWRVHGDEREKLGLVDFRWIDREWWKPGQCQSWFWMSWQALGSGTPPPTSVTIRVRDRVLVWIPRGESGATP